MNRGNPKRKQAWLTTAVLLVGVGSLFYYAVLAETSHAGHRNAMGGTSFEEVKTTHGSEWIEITRTTTVTGQQPAQRTYSAEVDWWAAAMLLIVFAFIGVVITLIHRSILRTGGFPAGHCQACGYNLTGVTSDACPECGEPLPESPKPQ